MRGGKSESRHETEAPRRCTRANEASMMVCTACQRAAEVSETTPAVGACTFACSFAVPLLVLSKDRAARQQRADSGATSRPSPPMAGSPRAQD